ncbi:MAG TPA: hypothetical protein VK324_12595 [Tepidisphaeraceae bacterium]|nr:hypothetical protein [Tepidisphaeraceae bacterium]
MRTARDHSDDAEELSYRPPRTGGSPALGAALDLAVLVILAAGASACAAVALAGAVYFLVAVGADGLLMTVMCLCTAGGFMIAATNNWARVRAITRRGEPTPQQRPPTRKRG